MHKCLPKFSCNRKRTSWFRMVILHNSRPRSKKDNIFFWRFSYLHTICICVFVCVCVCVCVIDKGILYLVECSWQWGCAIRFGCSLECCWYMWRINCGDFWTWNIGPFCKYADIIRCFPSVFSTRTCQLAIQTWFWLVIISCATRSHKVPNFGGHLE